MLIETDVVLLMKLHLVICIIVLHHFGDDTKFHFLLFNRQVAAHWIVIIGTAVNNKQQQVTSSFLDMHCSTNICCDLDFYKNVLLA